MTSELKKAFLRHVPLIWAIKALAVSLFFFAACSTLIHTVTLAYERWTPDGHWINYSQWVDPIKNSFEANEELVFQSNSERPREIDVRREDTPYFILDSWIFDTWETQYRPEDWENTKRMGPRFGNKISIPWAYSLPIKYSATAAKMCWYIIWYTPRHGFEKTDFYCTCRFGVNGYSAEGLDNQCE